MKHLGPSLLLLLLTCCGSAEATLIRLRGESQVSAALVQLGDIAEISEADAAEKEQLQRLTICPAPAAGRVARISLDTIRRELSLRGVDQTALRFTGASDSLVTRTLREVPVTTVAPTFDQRHLQRFQGELQQLISAYVQFQSPELSHLRIELSEQQLREILATAPADAVWNIQGGHAPWVDNQMFQLTGQSVDGTIVRHDVSCRISRKPRALGLKQGLPRGQVLRASDLVWIDTEQSEGFFTDPALVIGTETLRSLRADVPLRPDDVRAQPLIRRGEVVNVTAKVGSILVRRYCRSLDDGSLGQFVTLVPVDGKERLSARVSGLREAEIVLQTESTAAPPKGEAGGLTVAISGRQIGHELPARTQRESTPAMSGTQPNHSSPAPFRETTSSASPRMPAVPSDIQPTVSPVHSGRILANQPARLPE
ncbi:MAG: flagellar basal body P-ring formation chaperone FlgA [Planctomycetaceae bacterium]|nr:flagellar basal body P-ring formation protein FlgA [Planctomycetaceae bacterium]